MSGKSQPTTGNWQYRPHQSRHIVSDTGETVCKIHRGKKAQHNGPIVAAALDAAIALSMMLDAVEKIRQGKEVLDLEERIEQAEWVISKAKGETE